MSKTDYLHRRKIRTALKDAHGWDVVSHVDGTISVRPSSSNVSASTFREQVIAAVRRVRYEPTVISETDRKGQTKIRFHTPETLEQAGRGGHGFQAQ